MYVYTCICKNNKNGYNFSPSILLYKRESGRLSPPIPVTKLTESYADSYLLTISMMRIIFLMRVDSKDT